MVKPGRPGGLRCHPPPQYRQRNSASQAEQPGDKPQLQKLIFPQKAGVCISPFPLTPPAAQSSMGTRAVAPPACHPPADTAAAHTNAGGGGGLGILTVMHINDESNSCNEKLCACVPVCVCV